MKQKSRVEEDDDVFAFRDEDFPDEPVPWSKKLRTKFPNPNSDDDAFKYKILEKCIRAWHAETYLPGQVQMQMAPRLFVACMPVVIAFWLDRLRDLRPSTELPWTFDTAPATPPQVSKLSV